MFFLFVKLRILYPLEDTVLLEPSGTGTDRHGQPLRGQPPYQGQVFQNPIGRVCHVVLNWLSLFGSPFYQQDWLKNGIFTTKSSKVFLKLEQKIR